LAKVADFNLLHLHLALPFGVTPVEFAKIFGIRKLSCGVVCVILRLAVSVEHRLVTDRQRDRLTHDDAIYRASMTSRHGVAR